MSGYHGHTLSKDCWCGPTVAEADIDWEDERRKVRPVVSLPDATDSWKVGGETRGDKIVPRVLTALWLAAGLGAVAAGVVGRNPTDTVKRCCTLVSLRVTVIL